MVPTPDPVSQTIRYLDTFPLTCTYIYDKTNNYDGLIEMNCYLISIQMASANVLMGRETHSLK